MTKDLANQRDFIATITFEDGSTKETEPFKAVTTQVAASMVAHCGVSQSVRVVPNELKKHEEEKRTAAGWMRPDRPKRPERPSYRNFRR